LIEKMASFGYLSWAHAEMIMFDVDPGALIERFATYQPPTPKWTPPEAGPVAQP